MTKQEIEDKFARHEHVIEQLIEKVMKLELANNIQNTINRINDASTEGNQEDISDSSLRP